MPLLEQRIGFFCRDLNILQKYLRCGSKGINGYVAF